MNLSHLQPIHRLLTWTCFLDLKEIEEINLPLHSRVKHKKDPEKIQFLLIIMILVIFQGTILAFQQCLQEGEIIYHKDLFQN